MSQVLIQAHDADEALVRVHELHPELPRPRVAWAVNDLRQH
jgi:hypothetical protein